MSDAKDPLAEALATLANAINWPSTTELRAAVELATQLLKSASHLQQHYQDVINAAAAVWNASLGVASNEHSHGAELAAALKQACVDLQWAGHTPASLLPAQKPQLAEQSFKAGKAWADLGRWEAADAALCRALDLEPALRATALNTTAPTPQQERAACALWGALLLRLRALHRLSQELPAAAVLAKARELAANEALSPRQRAAFSLELVLTLAEEGATLLEGGQAAMAVRTLQAAHETLAGLQSLAPELEAAGQLRCMQEAAEQVLTLLAWAHLRSTNDCGGAEAALQCVHGLRELGPAAAGAVAVPFLSHQALLQLGRAGEAEAELLNVVTHEEGDLDVVVAAVKAALVTPGGAAGARGALATAMDNAAGDPSLVLELAQAVLAPLGPPAKRAQQALTDAETVVLDLLAEEQVQEGIALQPADCARLRALVWNHATRLLLQEACPEAAAPFYAASASLAAPEDAAAALEARQAQALCCMAARQYGAALEHLDAASELAPTHLPVAFLRYKVHLEAGDAAGASAALQALAAAEGADADVLRVACCEALDAGSPAAAQAALCALLQRIQADPALCAQLPAGYEAAIFHNLIHLILQAPSAAAPPPKAPKTGEGMDAATAMDVDGLMEGLEETEETKEDQAPAQAHALTPAQKFASLADWFDRAVERARAVGAAAFFTFEDGPPRQLEWLALQAWNQGVAAAQAGQARPAAVLMACCGHLCEVHPAPEEATLRRQQMAFLLAGAAALEEFDRDPAFRPSLNLATLRLQEARAAATAAAALQGEGNKEQPSAKADVYLLLLEFQLATRRKDPEAAAAAVAAAAALSGVTADHFGRMAAMCGEGSHRCGDTRRLALTAMLQRLTSQPALDYQAVAATLRLLVESATADADRLGLLQDAAGLVAAAPDGAFPPVEVRWLVTAAWNRGATHAKFGRGSEGQRFMALALELAEGVGGMEGEKVKMHEVLAAVEEEAQAAAVAVPEL